MHGWLKLGCMTGLLLAALLACSRPPLGESPTPPGLVPNPGQWAQYISEHSAGLVSRSEPLRIRFVDDVIDEGEVGKSMPGLVSVEPALEIDAVFNNPRELVLVPKQPLPSGRRYQIVLKGGQLASLPPVLGDYRFAIDVIAQGIDVSFQGVDPDPNNAQHLLVRGMLTSADVADADAVEKTLDAAFDGKPVSLHWQHSADSRRHAFRTAPLPRGEQPATVVFHWDAASVSGSGSGEHRIELPALGAFDVTRVGFVSGEQRALAVDFSDRLDPKQNIAGLVTLSGGEFTHRIEGNTLTLFPAANAGSELQLVVHAGLRSADGRRLERQVEQTIRFQTQQPGVRFVGRGSILPDGEQMTIPFEALNVASVQVTAMRVFDNKLGQFLQVNPLGGSQELKRVGRYLWKKTITLGNGHLNEWRRFAFDVGDLYAKEPGALYRFTLSINRGNSLYACSDAERAVPVPEAPLPANGDEYEEIDASGWDFADDYYGTGNRGDAGNPCQDAYYLYNPAAQSSRNFIAANIGLIAKAGSDGRLFIAANDIRTGKPLADARLTLFNYQDQPVGEARTDAQGMAQIMPEVKPFYVAARTRSARGYLKLGDGLALPVSHFDVGGTAVERGIKGTIYGERGVWRPGDVLHLTFVLQDPEDAIPDGHPALLELVNPQGQIVHTQSISKPVGDFYAFALQTRDDDSTGTWRAQVKLGGRQFERSVKIETVMPNRLKVELDTGEVLKKSESAQLQLFSQWLHGASAAGLKADVAVKLKPRPTGFTRNADFTFDDPTRQYRGEAQTIWEGKLDRDGRAVVDADIVADDTAAGFLTADFTTRVFESGGAFSIASQSVPFHPYRHYVGIKLPKGDLTRNMLLTDTTHTVEIATLDAEGNPVSLPNVEVSLHEIEWRWWWEQNGDGLASFESSSAHVQVHKGAIATEAGKGQWQFEVKYPEWGRYLVRACDLDGGHCAARIVYIDWPGWAGRAAEQSGPGANALQLSSDKPNYQVGDTAIVQLPPASKGRALLSIENGSGILSQQWLQLDGQRENFSLPITTAMAPNVYVSVTLLQPHEGKQNDRPIRLYGVLPVLVSDPATHLQPMLQVADEVRPESRMRVAVSEQSGRPMTYTLAVVDEGLLGLTNFRTPRLHSEFYRREALGVRSWDIYDDVVGAYGGALERLLALGGSDSGVDNNANKERKRFPPVVRFVGPFRLPAGETAQHEIELPPYVGAVRVMLIGGERGAYGSAEKTVTVKQPLMVQATLPRVLGPGEELRVPISVFVLDDAIRTVELTTTVEPPLTISGASRSELTFERSGDQLGFVTIKVGEQLGKTRVRFAVSAGAETAEQAIDIEVRAANPVSRRLITHVLEPGGRWSTPIAPHGLPGTNDALLEVAGVPPLNLGDRLQYLIRYPHGCVEQTTSAAFPQLYLNQLLQLPTAEQTRTQRNVEAAIDRLRQFQLPGGAFGYWPGAGDWHSWSTSYVGHFLLEAQRQGFQVAANMLADWTSFQKARAQVWVAGNDSDALDQAYRLYTLALAGVPELGAMNRLRERPNLPDLARWMLASSYKQAGLADVAARLILDRDMTLPAYPTEGASFGSPLRDRAMLLNAMLGVGDAMHTRDLADAIATELAGNGWYSTHSLSWSLLALSRFAGGASGHPLIFDYAVDDGDWQRQQSDKPLAQAQLGSHDQTTDLRLMNRGRSPLYISVVNRGVAPSGKEKAGNDSLTMTIAFADRDGHPLDPARLPQGSDMRATVTISNTTPLPLQNLALSQIVPSGWEIINTRTALAADAATESAFDYRDFRDDRVQTYFGLASRESRSFVLQINAAYPGRYYLPAWNVEAMYDAHRFARNAGRWVEVVRQEPAGQ